MPFSIDHYPPLPSPLLAIAQSEMPAIPRPLLCDQCPWEVRRLQWGTFDNLLWLDRWGPRVVPSYWQIWVASNSDSDVAQSYCCLATVWTYRVSMTAGVFAVDEVSCCVAIQFYDLKNAHDLLKVAPLPIIFLSLFCSFPHPTQVHPTRCFSLAHRLALILFSSNNFPIFQTQPHPPLPTDLHTSLCCTLHLEERTLVSLGNRG